MVLLVIDTQKLIVNNKLYKFDLFVSSVKKLINKARENSVEVIYVRHDDGEDSELTKGTDGFEIYEEFKPINDEKIFDKKVNSAFKGTGLLEYLRSKDEKGVVVVGLQTDYCVDATIKCGFEHGFKVIVPAYANTTVDNKFMSGEESYKYHNEFMWNKRYAECISIDETIKMMVSNKLKSVETKVNYDKCELIENLDNLHTTILGEERVKRNLSIEVDDVIKWCREKILNSNAIIIRRGKNWYIDIDNYIITVNAYSFTVITAHKKKK